MGIANNIAAFTALLPLLAAGSVRAGDYKPDNFRCPRAEPPVTIAAKKVIDVTRLGAIPNDGKDDYTAITKAFEQLAASPKGTELLFPAGTYNISPPTDNKTTHCLGLTHCESFIIEGTGAEILIDDPTKGFIRLEGCRDCMVRGFSVDYTSLPFTQGIIRKVDREAMRFEVEIEDGYPSPLAENFERSQTKWASVFENGPSGITLKRGANNLIPFRQCEKLGGNTYSVLTSAEAAGSLAPGDMYALIARYNGRPTYSANNCENVTFMECTNYAGPAGGFGIQNSPGCNVIKCNILRKPGRYISQDADCIHVTPSPLGPWIENCTFEGQMDDAINIKTELVYILEARSQNEFVVSGEIAKGDSLLLFNPREGALIGRCAVLWIKGERNNKVITTSEKFTGLKTGKDKSCDMFFNDNRSNESFVIRGNTFRNSRRYGMLIQATHGSITNNTMNGQSTGAITLQNSAKWPEGFVPRNVVISGNAIAGCGFDKSYLAESQGGTPVTIRTTTVGSTPAQWKGVGNIVITGNTVSSDSNYAVLLSGVNGALLENNKLTSKGPEKVYMENCENIKKR